MKNNPNEKKIQINADSNGQGEFFSSTQENTSCSEKGEKLLDKSVQNTQSKKILVTENHAIDLDSAKCDEEKCALKEKSSKSIAPQQSTPDQVRSQNTKMEKPYTACQQSTSAQMCSPNAKMKKPLPHVSNIKKKSISAMLSSAKKFKSPISLSTIVMIVTILFFGVNLIIILKEQKSKSSLESNSFYQKNFESLAQKYGRVMPSECKQGIYYGLDDVFNAYMQTIIPYLIGNKESIDNAIEMQSETLKKNLIIYGMPGTGKSFFACKIFLQAALNIKANTLHDALKTINLCLTDGEESQEIAKDLYDCNGIVEMYHINSSMFLSSLVGDSEKLLHNFLNFIDWRQQIVPVFIFLDEAEALLSARRESKGGGDEVGNNLKNIWLVWLDGINSQMNKRVFVMAATNYYNRIDNAIKRRFSSYLGIPSLVESEREKIIKETLCNTNIVESLTLNQIKDLVKSTEGFPCDVMMHLKTNMEGIRKTTKKQVPFGEVTKAIKSARIKIDDDMEKEAKRKKQEEKYSIFSDSGMSNPKEVETNLVWNNNSSNVLIKKEKMLYIEQQILGKCMIEAQKEEEVADAMFDSMENYISSTSTKTPNNPSHMDLIRFRHFEESSKSYLDVSKNIISDAGHRLAKFFVYLFPTYFAQY